MKLYSDVCPSAMTTVRTLIWILIPLGTMAALAGCAAGPNYKTPQIQTPDAWHETATKGLAQGQASLQTWWTVFNDPTLVSLIERAAKDNLQIKKALYRIQESRCQRGIATGSIFPSFGTEISYERAQASENTADAPKDNSSGFKAPFGGAVARRIANRVLAGATGTPVSGLGSGLGSSLGTGLVGGGGLGSSMLTGGNSMSLLSSSTGGVDATNLTAGGFDSSWELDTFGSVRRRIEAAEAGYQASIEQYRDTLVTLLAEVAINYMEVRTLQARIGFARENVALQHQTLAITRDRLSKGAPAQFDVAQAESNLANSEAEIPILEAGLVQAINRLGLLIGQSPATLHETLGKIGPIPLPPREVTVGLPVDLLRQRPDVRMAERELAAETALIGVAMADLYPRFSLNGKFALAAEEIKDIANWDSRNWGFGPAMRWTIFDGMRNFYRVAAAEAATEQARAQYEHSVLTALQDVENVMVAYKQEEVRHEALSRAVTASRQASGMALDLYQNGRSDFQNVLDVQRSLFQQQDALSLSEGLIAKNLVALYKALGGGWAEEMPTTQPSSPTIIDQVVSNSEKVTETITSTTGKVNAIKDKFMPTPDKLVQTATEAAKKVPVTSGKASSTTSLISSVDDINKSLSKTAKTLPATDLKIPSIDKVAESIISVTQPAPK